MAEISGGHMSVRSLVAGHLGRQEIDRVRTQQYSHTIQVISRQLTLHITDFSSSIRFRYDLDSGLITLYITLLILQRTRILCLKLQVGHSAIFPE